MKRAFPNKTNRKDSYTRSLFISIACLLWVSTVLAQEQLARQWELQSSSLEFTAEDIDHLRIENSTSGKLELVLKDEQPFARTVVFQKHQSFSELKISKETTELAPTVFRKFITEELQRASVIVRIPKDKTLVVTVRETSIEVANYDGNLTIFSQRGNIQLHTVKQATSIQLFQGTITATIDGSFELQSNRGTITVNDQPCVSPCSQKMVAGPLLKVQSIHAHIFVRTLE